MEMIISEIHMAKTNNYNNLNINSKTKNLTQHTEFK